MGFRVKQGLNGHRSDIRRINESFRPTAGRNRNCGADHGQMLVTEVLHDPCRTEDGMIEAALRKVEFDGADVDPGGPGRWGRR
jgi:hypothetical protein